MNADQIQTRTLDEAKQAAAKMSISLCPGDLEAMAFGFLSHDMAMALQILSFCSGRTRADEAKRLEILAKFSSPAGDSPRSRRRAVEELPRATDPTGKEAYQ